jgi:hypothetical protein
MPLARRLVPLLCICAFVCVCVSADASAARRGLPSCAAAPCPSDRGRQVVILDYFRGRHFPRLVRAAKHSGLPRDTPIYYGSYWGVGVNTRPPPRTPPPHRPPGKPKPVMPGRRYAPIFTFARTNFWGRRRLGPEERRLVQHGAIRGRIPRLRLLFRRSGHYRHEAGLEIGRRFRDRIRHRRARHQRVVTWQFDEIPTEAAGHRGWKYRQIVAGILRGLTYGRRELGDVKLPGIVFVPGKAIGIRDRHFWRVVNRATLYLVGEEYPVFTGSPIRAAAAHSTWRSRLYRSGGARRRLAKKYVAGMTPGYRIVGGLGGNVHRRSHGFVRHWRMSYVRARARHGVAGFAEYNFDYRNASGAVMNDVLRALGRGVRVLRRR